MDSFLHLYPHPIAEEELPVLFNNPFHYTPHPLCYEAALEVQAYLEAHHDCLGELRQAGKMFGVLLVRSEGIVGYLAAFSGLLQGSSHEPFFVPPIYDLCDSASHFKQEEAEISALNRKIMELEQATDYRSLLTAREEKAQALDRNLQMAREQLKTSKKHRDTLRRSTHLSPEEEEQLLEESRFQKAEWKRMKLRGQEELQKIETEIKIFECNLHCWREERKKRSVVLQRYLFEQYRLLNGKGEKSTVNSIFDAIGKVPPGGTGECAAPKLLQYAYLQKMQPLALAEFWWGADSMKEVRKAGYFYPSCKAKCEPLLAFMLTGLSFDEENAPNALESAHPEILYEDDYLLVVNKPSGMLTVPGKRNEQSLYQWAREKYPDADGPLVVHRLDMDTSGVLILAKNKEVHKHLQLQFINQTVYKEYIALLDGLLSQKQGEITLPIAPDLHNRPYQMVDRNGKEALTYYRVLEEMEGKTRVLFRPLTGRTHQLRLHAAHPLGLNTPICGDALYGKSGDRLCLHASCIGFMHPIGQRWMEIRQQSSF